MPERAGCNSAPPVLHGLLRVPRLPQHLFAIVVLKPDDGLGVCPVLAVQRASALVKVDPAETVCCGIGVGIESVCVHLGHHVSMMLV